MKKKFAEHEQKTYLNNSTKSDWKRQLEFGIGLMSQAVNNKRDIEGNSLNETQINDAKCIISRLETQLTTLLNDQ
jgi:hypothetical protein